MDDKLTTASCYCFYNTTFKDGKMLVKYKDTQYKETGNSRLLTDFQFTP